MLWRSVQTQWRIGFAGATGLDYLAVERVAEVLGLGLDRPMLEKIQALEGAQLNRWAMQRARKNDGS